MPGFYIRPMFDRIIFSGIFLWGGWGGQGNAPLPSPTPMAGPQAPHQLNPALSNLTYRCTWTISRKWTNKISENGRGLSHVTLIKFGTPSNISPKREKLQTSNLTYRYMWTISPKWTNKISQKGRGLGHPTLIKFGTPSNISPKRVKLHT